jgi:hypothetical protein
MPRKISFCLMATLLAGSCLAGDSTMDRATLRGLKAIKVVVDPPPSDIEREGFDREHLRTIIEEKLRGAGIKIDNDSIEFLGLGISSGPGGRKSPITFRKGSSPSLTWALGVYQVVLLSRDQTTKTVAETWGVDKVISADPKARDRLVSGALDELVDQFAKAYRAVNPL